MPNKRDHKHTTQKPVAPPADDEAGAISTAPASGGEEEEEEKEPQTTSGNEHQIREEVIEVRVSNTPAAKHMIQTPGEEF